MKKLRFVGLFVIFASALVLMALAAQSRSASHTRPPNTPAGAQGLPTEAALPGTKPPITFAKAVTYSSGGFYASLVAIADLDGDGTPDLAVVNACQGSGGSSNCTNGGEVSVLLGDKSGAFRALGSYNSGGIAAAAIAIADLNGDGHPDLVVANECASATNCDNGTVSVFFGNGDGTFQAPVIYNAGYATDSVAIADLNGDGHLDLVVANDTQCVTCSNGAVSVLLGNGNGTFQAATTYSSGGGDAVSVAIADLNSDHHPDVVVANKCLTVNNCNYGGVGVLLGKGDGTFLNATTYSSGAASATSVAILDLDGDNIPDLAVSNLCNHGFQCLHGVVSVLVGKGNGAFLAATTYLSGGYEATSVAIHDVNGDGIPDLVVDNVCKNTGTCNFGGVSVLLGMSNRNFQNPISYSSVGADASWIVIADVNSDGRPDLVTANYCANTSDCDGTVAVLLNTTSDKTTTALVSSPNPSQVNQSVLFTVTVTSTPPIADGEVITFYNGKTILGTAATAGGTASVSLAFSKAATYTVKASYPGDAFHKTTSGTVKQVVSP